MQKDNIMVSIACAAYNHEKYIAEALESFVNQKTDFKFEVLIHDDASTDSTADIIRQYENKYPDIIKPIYQTENQYSKGVKISPTFAFPRAKGKYIAFCEGDDYWTDMDKLQKQVDFLEANPDYNCCVHAFSTYDRKTGKSEQKRLADCSCRLAPEDVIKNGGGWIATNSIIINKEFLMSMPETFINGSFGDYQIQIYAAASGKMYYINEDMSTYNMLTPGSWGVNNSSAEKSVKYKTTLLSVLKKVNEFYNYKYDNAINDVIIAEEYTLMILQGNLKELIKNKKYEAYFKSKPLKQRASLTVKAYFPHLHRALKSIIKR